MMKKKAEPKFLRSIENAIMDTEGLLADYLKDYAEYGMDDIANDLIGINATFKTVLLRVKYALVKESGERYGS